MNEMAKLTAGARPRAESAGRMNPAERLHRLERDLARISRFQHRLAVEKTRKREEATRLRLSLTYDERVRYETLSQLDTAFGAVRHVLRIPEARGGEPWLP